MNDDLKKQINEIENRQVRLEKLIARLAADQSRFSDQLELLRDQLNEMVLAGSDASETAFPERPPPFPKIVEKEKTEAAAHSDEAVVPETFEEPKTAEESEQPTAAAAFETEEATFPEPKKIRNWELLFGRFGLVLVGILFLLTGLVFLSTYAYQNWVSEVPRLVKVLFLLAASGGFSILGHFLEKKFERFRQYGRALFAGGMGATYYILYAAHFAPALKIIGSPIGAAFLLTAWAALMLVIAVRKRSELIALLSLGLAFYGTVVNPTGFLALFSALLLSGAGIFLLIREQWIKLGTGTVLIAYGSQIYWWGFYPNEGIPEAVRIIFPISLWILFAVFPAVKQAKELPQKWIASLSWLNNSGAWFLLVFSGPGLTPHSEFNTISILAGIALIGVAAVAHRGNPLPKQLEIVHATSGLFFLTLGLMLAYAGHTRFLIIGAEAVLLLLISRKLENRWMVPASSLLFFAALFFALPDVRITELEWRAYLSLTILSAIFAILLRQENAEWMLTITYFANLITWTIFLFGVLKQWPVSPALILLWIAIVGLLLLSNFVKKANRLSGLANTGYGAAFVGVYWFADLFRSLSSWENGAISLLSVGSIAFLWWLSPTVPDPFPSEKDDLDFGKQIRILLEGFLSAALLIAAIAALFKNSISLIWAAPLLGLIAAFSAESFNRRSLAITSFFFHLFAIAAFLDPLHLSFRLLALVPALAILAHLVFSDLKGTQISRSGSIHLLAPLAMIAAIPAADLLFSRPELAWILIPLFFTGWAIRRSIPALATIWGIAGFVGISVFSFYQYQPIDWLWYLLPLILLALHALLFLLYRKESEWKFLQQASFALGAGTFLLMSGFHVYTRFSGSGLSVTWAVTAILFFTIGLLMKCRPYRLSALGLVIAAVINLMLVDVMRLESAGRILSFFVLGIILLLLGFLYNRYQDQIRKFL